MGRLGVSGGKSGRIEEHTAERKRRELLAHLRALTSTDWHLLALGWRKLALDGTRTYWHLAAGRWNRPFPHEFGHKGACQTG